MNKVIEFYYDFGSPASYLAATQIDSLALRNDAEVIYKPFVVGAVFKATDNSSPMTIPAKGKYTMMDFQRWAGFWGVPFAMNDNFPINTILHMKMAVAVQLYYPQRLAEFNKALFDAMWADNKNITLPVIVSDLCNSIGLDAGKLIELIEQDDVRAALRANTEEAIARGAFGAPSMFYRDELFFGQDRLPMLERALQAS